MCFVLSRGGGHPGPSWPQPAPERSFHDRAWTGRNRLLGDFRENQRKSIIQKQTTIHDSLTPRVNCRRMGFPAEIWVFLQTNAFSYRKMHFPAENCAFLWQNAVSCRKIRFWGGHMAGNRRRWQEGFRAQESRTLANFHKNLRESAKICVWAWFVPLGFSP